MPDLIAFPFRIAPAGNVATNPQGSTDYYAELLAVLIGTKPGERQQVPLFGLSDPTFSTVDEHELSSKVAVFGPPVRVLSVNTRYTSSTTQDVSVEFTSLG